MALGMYFLIFRWVGCTWINNAVRLLSRWDCIQQKLLLYFVIKQNLVWALSHFGHLWHQLNGVTIGNHIFQLMPFWIHAEAFILKLRTKPTKKKKTHPNNWKHSQRCIFVMYKQCWLMLVRRAWEVNRTLSFCILFKWNLLHVDKKVHLFNEKQSQNKTDLQKLYDWPYNFSTVLLIFKWNLNDIRFANFTIQIFVFSLTSWSM